MKEFDYIKVPFYQKIITKDKIGNTILANKDIFIRISFEALCKLIEENRILHMSTYEICSHKKKFVEKGHYFITIRSKNSFIKPRLGSVKLDKMSQFEEEKIVEAVIKSNNVLYVSMLINNKLMKEYWTRFHDLVLSSNDIKLLCFYALYDTANHKLYFDKIIKSDNVVHDVFFEKYFNKYGSEELNEQIVEKLINKPNESYYLLRLIESKKVTISRDVLVDVAIKLKNPLLALHIIKNCDFERCEDMFRIIMESSSKNMIWQLISLTKKEAKTEKMLKKFVLNSNSAKICFNYLKFSAIQDEEEREDLIFAIDAYSNRQGNNKKIKEETMTELEILSRN